MCVEYDNESTLIALGGKLRRRWSFMGRSRKSITVLNAMGPDAPLDDDIDDQILKYHLERLRDVTPSVQRVVKNVKWFESYHQNYVAFVKALKIDAD